MYLLDTDILSNLMRRTPAATLLAKLVSVPPEQQFTSSITLGELVYGALRLGNRAPALLQRILQVMPSTLPVLPFDATAARRYGEIRAFLEQEGQAIGDADLRIAAIALANGMIVVTGNIRHFHRVPDLRVENWL